METFVTTPNNPTVINKRVRRFVITPTMITTSMIINDQVVLSHDVHALPGQGGWATFLHQFGLRIGKHIAEHPQGRLIEVIDVQTNKIVAGLCQRLKFRVWQIDIPED